MWLDDDTLKQDRQFGYNVTFLARSLNRCCHRSAVMWYICIVELPVTQSTVFGVSGVIETQERVLFLTVGMRMLMSTM